MKQKTTEQKIPWISLGALVPFLPDDPIIVEAGAHSGKDTSKLKKQWPKSTIHAFEPIPVLYDQLIERTKEYPNIFWYQQALSNSVGTAPMHVSEGRTDACSSLFPPHGLLTEGRPDIVFNQILSVPTTTLDAWAKLHAIPQVDLLWLDLQGAELVALQGAVQLLATVKAIHTEINEAERYIGGVLYNELKEFLETQGFYAHIKAIHKHSWGNALFIRI